jgi:HSP20 family molecular chaperone IbpA
MLFRANRLLAPDELLAPDVLHTTWPTAAEPATFAPPIEASEDEQAFTLAFRVVGLEPSRLLVEVLEGTLFVREVRITGRARAATARRGRVRAFTLPSAVDARSLESNVDSDILTVRVVKVSSPRRSLVIRSKP